jgi:hypothetical protein
VLKYKLELLSTERRPFCSHELQQLNHLFLFHLRPDRCQKFHQILNIKQSILVTVQNIKHQFSRCLIVFLILPNKTVNPLLKVIIMNQLIFVIFVCSLSVFNHVSKETSGCPLRVLFGKTGICSFEFLYVDDSSVAIGVGLLVGKLELVFVQVVHVL